MTLMHPSPERLDAFGRGDVPEPEAATIEDHLAACPDCVKKLAEGSSDDVLIGLVRAGSQTTFAIGPGTGAPGRFVPPDVPSGYEILETIGRGGMGVVYKASQRALGRIVALKQIRTGPDADAQELARFRTEAEAAAQLRHPNIVQVYDVGLRDGSPFFAMELVEGGSLSARMREGVLRPRDAADLVGSIARAIHHAHQAGIVHRDLKPGNILLTPDGTPKVADFGLAKRLDVEVGPTLSGVLLGTPGYMAPEQAEGGAIGPSADIYALGGILYECLTGRPPFQAATTLETLEQVRSCDPLPPGRIQAGLSRDVQTICMKCLEKSPRRRYATAALLADDLERFLRGEPIAARPTGLVERGLKWARRKPSHAALAGLSLATAIGAIAGLISHEARLRVEIENTNRAAREARAQRALADANYREARGALRQILERSNDPKFTGTPHSFELRRIQAEAALGFYDRVLAAADSPDPAVRLDTAVALREAANLQIGLGRLEPAERNLKRSLQLLDALAEDRQDDASLVRERMVTQIKLGVMLMSRDNARSQAALGAALEFADQLARANGDSWTARNDLSWCEDNLGSALVFAKKLREAEAHYLRAAELRKTLVRERPDDIGERVELASTLANLGQVRAQDRPEVADADLAEAAGLLDKARETKPDEFEYILPLVHLLNNWGNLAAASGRPDLALERQARGLALIEPLLRSQPDLKDPRLAAMNLHGSRANLLGSQGRHAEAVSDWDQVLALNDVPADEAAYRFARLLALLKAGDHARAVAEIERVAPPAQGGSPPSGADQYNFACFYALASAAAARDAALPPERRAELARTYAENALEWLGRCAAAGFLKIPANRDHARKDPDLESIRARHEFARIIEAAPPPRRP